MEEGQYVRVIADKEGDGSAIDWYGKVISHDTAYGITTIGVVSNLPEHLRHFRDGAAFEDGELIAVSEQEYMKAKWLGLQSTNARS